MKKAEIHSIKEIRKDFCNETFINVHRFSKPSDENAVYLPVGEMHGILILKKYKFKKMGEYLILK